MFSSALADNKAYALISGKSSTDRTSPFESIKTFEANLAQLKDIIANDNQGFKDCLQALVDDIQEEDRRIKLFRKKAQHDELNLILSDTIKLIPPPQTAKETHRANIAPQVQVLLAADYLNKIGKIRRSAYASKFCGVMSYIGMTVLVAAAVAGALFCAITGVLTPLLVAFVGAFTASASILGLGYTGQEFFRRAKSKAKLSTSMQNLHTAVMSKRN